MTEVTNPINTEITPANAKTLVVALIGESGAGKSTFAQELSKAFPGLYHQCRQVTTRPRRVEEAEDAYDFLNDEAEYRAIEDTLIAKTVINKNGVDTYYGTRFDNDPTKIHVIVVNEKGLDNLKDSLFSPTSKFLNCRLQVVAITRHNCGDDPSTFVVRESRDQEFVQQEVEFVTNYTRTEALGEQELRPIALTNTFRIPLELHITTLHELVMMNVTGVMPDYMQAAFNNASAPTDAEEEEVYNTEAINDR